MGSLFEERPARAGPAPLADRMRPRSLDEILGQDELLAEDGMLRRALAKGSLPSLVLWGPPGCGKTSLALLLAAKLDARFAPFSAVLSGVKELRAVCREAERERARGRRTILFVDEIHRFNKAQQDAFLPFVERGDVILIGATTENPSFALTGALLSRVSVLRMRAPSAADAVALCRRALADSERGLGDLGLEATDEALAAIAKLSAGDLRRALNLLEGAASVVPAGRKRIERADVERAAQGPVLLHDRAGDVHFDLLSAFHKSLRNSDPDAALYYLVRMLEAGEDGLVPARRMVAFAAEDVGLADPMALQVAVSAMQAFRFLGMPEGRLVLGEACVYLALAPRSNSVYRALEAARRAVRDHPEARPPLQLRNAPTKLLADLGHGAGYVYAHDTEEGVAAMPCLPEELQGLVFYEPGRRGFEQRLRERLAELARARARDARRRRAPDGGTSGPSRDQV